jgi:hypothetical protein
MLRPFRRLGVLIVVLLAAPLQAGFPTIPPPLAQRVAVSDLVVRGKVTGVDEGPVQAYPLVKVAGGARVEFRVATVRVESVIAGSGKVEDIRVAYLTPPPPRNTPIALREGETGCYFLRRHPEEPFYVISTPWDFLDGTKKETFAKALATVKRCAALLADPGPGLRSKDADERLLTAAVLIYRYRTPRFVYKGAPQTKPIDAEQSRLILKILCEGELEPPEDDEPFTRLTLFFRLNLTAKDGWVPPRALQEVPTAARKWLEDNAATYRIQQYVAAKP